MTHLPSHRCVVPFLMSALLSVLFLMAGCSGPGKKLFYTTLPSHWAGPESPQVRLFEDQEVITFVIQGYEKDTLNIEIIDLNSGTIEESFIVYISGRTHRQEHGIRLAKGNYMAKLLIHGDLKETWLFTVEELDYPQ